MRSVRSSLGLLTAAVVGLASCSGNEVTRPEPRAPDAAASLRGGPFERIPAPPARFVPCDSAAPVQGSADIGVKGGSIVVGGNRLVVPSGALTATVHITLTVPGNGQAFIALQPTGLVFLKQVRLVFNTRGCDLFPPARPWGTLYAVYVDDAGHVLDRLPAWPSARRTISTAISHFSGYGLAW